LPMKLLGRSRSDIGAVANALMQMKSLQNQWKLPTELSHYRIFPRDFAARSRCRLKCSRMSRANFRVVR
jgi:hypothetical protein